MQSVHQLWPDGVPEGDQDPHEWGRYYWALLHAAGDRARGDARLRSELLGVVWALRDVLPCQSCRKSLRITLGGAPPRDDEDLGDWLMRLEETVAGRVGGPAGAARVATRGIRGSAWAVRTCDADQARAVAYSLRSAQARRDRPASIERWYRSFRVFLRGMTALVPPDPHGAMVMMSTNLSTIPKLAYDLRAWLEACLDAVAINAQSRARAAHEAARAARPSGRDHAAHGGRSRAGRPTRPAQPGADVAIHGLRHPSRGVPMSRAQSGHGTQARVWRARHRNL